MTATVSDSTRRRSSRRTKKRIYTVGDIVEIESGGVTIEGRLVSRCSDENATNPTWRAIFLDNNEGKDDKEVYESSFGEILGKVDPEKEIKATMATRKTRKESPLTLIDPTTVITKPTDTPILVSQESKQSKKTSSGSSSNSLSESSMTTPTSDASKARTSARDERIRRRQAKLEDSVVKRAATSVTKHSFASNTKTCDNKQMHAKKITITMLTGTLYLYHGLTRRAEFIRKV
ncbi:hypothetical protein MPSEU_001069200 [Mayamaea pseudoterrestris]|nr:hypothetical protein MPSEU_001069200 [Mayamaea pseudoterrestris]